MGGPASSTTAEIYMQAYERTAITTALHPPKVWERFVDDVYSILKRTHLENIFHHINNLHQNVKFTMEEVSNGELEFLDTLLKGNNGEIYDCSNCQAVYIGESKRSLKLRSGEHKRSIRNCDCDKNEITKDCWEADHNVNWDQKKVIDGKSRLIPGKIKETIHFLKNPNHTNKIS